LANSARCLGSLLIGAKNYDSNGVVAAKQPVPSEKLGLEPGDSAFLRQSVWRFPRESGNFGEVESIDVLGKREYSWLHPRELFSQETKFHLGNPG
jgi:hypothetical protein